MTHVPLTGMIMTVPNNRRDLLNCLLPEDILAIFQALQGTTLNVVIGLGNSDNYYWAVVFGEEKITFLVPADGMSLSYEAAMAFERARTASLRQGVIIRPSVYYKYMEAEEAISRNVAAGRHWSVGLY